MPLIGKIILEDLEGVSNMETYDVLSILISKSPPT